MILFYYYYYIFFKKKKKRKEVFSGSQAPIWPYVTKWAVNNLQRQH
jgi:hypothetical protein